MKRIISRTVVVLLLVCCFALLLAFAQPGSSPPQTTWDHLDIGPTGIKGTTESTGPTWRLEGAGADIWGSADSFHFNFFLWEGDVEIVARVLSVEKTDPWAKAGIMIRASLQPTSPHAFIASTPEKGSVFIRRLTSGARSKDDAHQAMRMVKEGSKVLFQQRGSAGVDQAVDALTSQNSARWLRLIRNGNIIRTFESMDGQNWEWLGTESIDLPAKAYIGLAVTSHNGNRLCRAEFDQVSLSSPGAWSSEVARAGGGDGLQATYYRKIDLSDPVLNRVDPTVNFDWGTEAPASSLGRNQFSVRWEGELEAQYSEPYAIHLISDDRARLWLNGELLIDEWYEHGEQVSSAVANLEAGHRYLLRLEFFENRGRAIAKLLWSSPSTPQQVIPQSQLFSRITDQDNDGLPDLWETVNGLNPGDSTDAEKIVNGSFMTGRQKFKSSLEPSRPSKSMGAWLSQDIGRVGKEGFAEANNGSWTIQGSGADIWANTDGFHWIFQPWRGDGQLVARVASQDTTDPWAKAGVVIRSAALADAPFMMLARTPENGLSLLRRFLKGQAASSQSAASPAVQPWLKLERRGEVISAYCSADGAQWTWIGTEAFPAEKDVFIGLAVCSHDNSKLGMAVFDQVSITGVEPVQPFRLGQGSGDGLNATYFDSNTGFSVNRVDASLDFDWDIDSPAPGVAADHFSARWTGYLLAPSSGLFALHLLSDDGARLWINDQLVIDAWADHGAEEAVVRVQFEAGRRYAIKVEYFERTLEAIVRLLWSAPSLPRQPVPQNYLYSKLDSGTAILPGVASTVGTSNTRVITGDPSSLASNKEQADNRSPTSADAQSGSPKKNTLTPTITGVRLDAVLAGANTSARQGHWEMEDSSIRAVGRRGWLEYEFTVVTADIYRLEVEGASDNPFDMDSGFYLVASVDGEPLGRYLLDAPIGQTGVIQVSTPWLAAGSHRFRLFWDNTRARRSLKINQVRLQVLEGPDANHNGIKDWVEEKLARENGIEGVAGGTADGSEGANVAGWRSVVSPACLEGRGRFLGAMKIQLKNGQILQPQPQPNDRWYAQIPLVPGQPVEVEVSYQNGGRIERVEIAWSPATISESEELLVRSGDSILIASAPDVEPAILSAPSLNRDIQVNGVTRYSGEISRLIPCAFDQPGVFSLVENLRQDRAVLHSRSWKVRAVAASLPGSQVAWTGKPRLWNNLSVSREAVLDFDDRLQVEPDTSFQGDKRYRVTVDRPEDRHAVVRLGGNGPILASTSIRGITVSGVSESGAIFGETYEDKSRRVEIAIAQTRVFPEVRIELVIVVAGVMFEDGSLAKTLRASDFDETGMALIKFIIAPGVQTSNCHVMRVYQNETFLGEY